LVYIFFEFLSAAKLHKNSDICACEIKKLLFFIKLAASDSIIDRIVKPSYNFNLYGENKRK